MSVFEEKRLENSMCSVRRELSVDAMPLQKVFFGELKGLSVFEGKATRKLNVKCEARIKRGCHAPAKSFFRELKMKERTVCFRGYPPRNLHQFEKKWIID